MAGTAGCECPVAIAPELTPHLLTVGRYLGGEGRGGEGRGGEEEGGREGRREGGREGGRRWNLS